jgi:hypothetical protein
MRHSLSLTATLSLILFIAGVGLLFAAQEEKLTITTYFPAPYGSYRELTTTSSTYLATGGSGNVGIGTTAPTGLLQVAGSANVGIFVKASGNAGIGTTSPSGYKLYLKGNLNVTGDVDSIYNDTATYPVPSGGVTVMLGFYPPSSNPCSITIEEGIITASTCT